MPDTPTPQGVVAIPEGETGPWLRHAKVLIAGAEKARQMGDTAASVEMATAAAQCVRIHKNLRGIE